MRILSKFLYILSFLVTYSWSNDDIDYYVKLIQTEVKRSETFSVDTDSQKNKPLTNEYIEYGTFDHIVIGAGSAGAIVASRLSEDPFRNVLLLEAGGLNTNFTEIPSMWGVLLNLEYNWNYYTIPQKTSCLGMAGKRCAYPRGKMLGGSSGINGLLYTRGSQRDFNNWCAQGNPGWCYKDVLPFFKRTENLKVAGDRTYHGIDGYVDVDHAKPNTRQQRAYIKANQELNRPFLDYNGFRQEGVGIIQLNINNGRRASTALFLKASSKRSNLKILPHSHVTRILISKNTKKAIGVLFANNNKYYVAMSRSDIVVSAGTIGSPHLLMLSGIGPALHLKQFKIPVIKDLPVGRNFQDHVAFNLLHFETDFSRWSKSLEENIEDYLNGFGAFTDGFNSKAVAFVRTNLTKIDDYADIELLLLGTNSSSVYFKNLFNYDEELFEFGFPKEHLSRIFSIMVCLLHPESRGYLKLNSSDPFDYPIIDSKLLSDSHFKDIATLYEGIQLALKLLETTSFKKLGSRLYRVHLPACKQYAYMSRDYWYCHIRQAASSFAHIAGTCKMGPDPRQGAVVDHQLKVHGIKNLRVADASIMPLIPGAHTNAPTMMIGEKAAQMIRESS